MTIDMMFETVTAVTVTPVPASPRPSGELHQ